MAMGGFANAVSFSDMPDLGSESVEIAAEKVDNATTDNSANPEATYSPLLKEVANTQKGKKNKRSRRASKSSKSAAADPASEDLNLHVEAGWSEDDKDDKERPTKRLAVNAEDGSPVAAKKLNSMLESFTIRAVVTRKDVDVIFGHGEDKKSGLESETATEISVVAGNDDPEIVVDRVVSVKGHIDSVAVAYKHIADGILSIKEQAAAAKTSAKNAVVASKGGASTHGAAAKEANLAEETNTDSKANAGEKDMVADPEDAATANDGDAEPGMADDRADEDTSTLEKSKPDEPVEDKSKTSSDKPQSSARITLRMLVPHKCVGSIMGHGGKTINKIRDTASVSIHTSESTLPCSSERIVELVGTPTSIQKAIRLIAEALTKDIGSYNSADYYVPAANLPSAMTVDTQARKRKDNRRPGYGDGHAGNRGHGNRNSGFRGHNNSGSYGDYSQARGPSGSSGNFRSGGNNNRHDRHDRNDRHDRYGRSGNNRQAGRHRGPGAISDANRTPIGGDSAPGYQNQHGNGSFRGNSQPGMRAGAPPAMGYGGYVVPAAAAYPMYAAQGAIAGGRPPGAQYGGVTSNIAAQVGATSSAGVYRSGYNAGAAPYQFAVPAAYGYAPVPAQSAYGAQPMHPGATATPGYPQRSYSGYSNNRLPASQSTMGSGGAAMGNSSANSAGQTIQQIYVPGDRIGAVIGRRGETINTIRRSTNARVDIQDSAQGAKERLVVITGEYGQVRLAYDQIKEQIEKPRPAGHSF
ncbi:RNA binding protein, heterogenous nuclear RNP-K like protein [Coemansia sp. RSA 353]|nr:RNA binding protein, heterogenous nuclear RNP-K like protein [Coemansia sp. RSA 788]KAJ2145330.1 RNA binding protein, heterogenous nuclear RNP-K like protein [Coemansia sp. RSA 564]KAJ2165305.1 RNA binding protein, heterogenous nuclear RNP-K like protein [Coemansia sp. RSA 562]KAJ2174938.1 RNA binding protein, heterogenous nuclear RNP-K like protein [Coemansia sp. RSA 560]KAJ2186952.1 RNA binding protein, heterogenous nuclear RNP-K like protein [Coemansia sp. RSA 532]KAJ2195334.1 RNA bindin